MRAANLFAEDVDAREGDQHVVEAGQPVCNRQRRDSENVEPANGRSDPGDEPRQDMHVPAGGEQELEAAERSEVLGA